MLGPGTRHHPSQLHPRGLQSVESGPWERVGHVSGTLPPQLFCSAHRLDPTGLSYLGDSGLCPCASSQVEGERRKEASSWRREGSGRQSSGGGLPTQAGPRTHLGLSAGTRARPLPSPPHLAQGHSSAQKDPRWLLKEYGVPLGSARYMLHRHLLALMAQLPPKLTCAHTNTHSHWLADTHSRQTLPALPPGLADAPLCTLCSSHPV